MELMDTLRTPNQSFVAWLAVHVGYPCCLTLKNQLIRRGAAGLLVAWLAACNLSLSPKTREAREELVGKLVFRAPAESGYSFYSVDGSFLNTILLDRQFTQRNLDNLISAAPDSSRFAFYRSASFVRSGTCESLVVQGLDGNAWELLEHCAEFSTDEQGFQQIVWTARDGSSFLILENSALWRFQQNQDRLQGTQLESGVRAFDSAAGSVFFLTENDPSRLHWRALASAEVRTSDSLALPESFDGIEATPDGSRLLIYRKDPDRNGALYEMKLVDLETGLVTPLFLPFGVRIYKALPLRGSTKAVLLVLQGGERFDGAVLPKYYLWNFLTGEFTWILTAWKELELHELPGNFLQR
jgi:hypothetical protein